MAYRRTSRIEARRAGVRRRIVDSAVALIASDGYRSAHVARIAGRARIASGTVYCHFPSKAELCAEVFRTVCGRELAAVTDVSRDSASAPRRIARALETFARRALHARRLAYALLVEPVDTAVDVERLAFRRAYAELFAGIVGEGVAAGTLPHQNPAVAAASLVGAMSEALVGPLSSTPVRGRDVDDLVDAVVGFCMRAITGKEHWHDGSSRAGAVPRHPRGTEPSAAARGVQRLRGGPRAERGRRA